MVCISQKAPPLRSSPIPVCVEGALGLSTSPPSAGGLPPSSPTVEVGWSPGDVLVQPSAAGTGTAAICAGPTTVMGALHVPGGNLWRQPFFSSGDGKCASCASDAPGGLSLYSPEPLGSNSCSSATFICGCRTSMLPTGAYSSDWQPRQVLSLKLSEKLFSHDATDSG
eukprot:scaffold1629_cov369-Prasinococcus_capsulatus_cf.AAC.3